MIFKVKLNKYLHFETYNQIMYYIYIFNYYYYIKSI